MILLPDAARTGTFKNLKNKQEKTKTTIIQLLWHFFLTVTILVICSPCDPMTLSIQHESMEGWQAINPITGQRCTNGRLCSSDSWKVRYFHEREEKVSSYTWKRGINGLPESISKSKARKEAEHDSSQTWKPEYSPLLHFHRHDKTKASQEHVLPCANGREESTAIEIKLVAQLQGKKWTEAEPLFSHSVGANPAWQSLYVLLWERAERWARQG